MSRSPKLAYVVQLDLPGYPVKIGQSRAPLSRWQQFNHGTPVDCRIVGVTVDGAQREADMLEATAATAIKGEWRYPNQHLLALVRSYFAKGEWFVPAANKAAHVADMRVRERILEIAPRAKAYSVCASSCGYGWAIPILQAALGTDDLLHAHWAGFAKADVAPNLSWPPALSDTHKGEAA